MFNRPQSIRQKITLGYYLGLMGILAVSLLTYMNLLRVDRKVESAEVIEDFFNTTLEARRFEKNYFLYEKEEDYEEHARFVARAIDMLDKYPAAFEGITPDVTLTKTRQGFEEYGRLMAQVHEFNVKVPRTGAFSRSRDAIEDLARKKGKDITGLAEKMNVAEKGNIRSLLGHSRTVLWASILVLVAFGIVIGQTMAISVVRPLKLLERYTEKISKGEFVRHEGRVREKEVDSLLIAFNRMTAELEHRQHQLVLSEKLASLGTLLSGVAHELNNPLSNISTSAQILAEEIADPDVEYKRELIRQIEGQSDKARDIVRTLLEFSREREFKKEAVPLRKNLEETLVLLRGQIPAKVELYLVVPEGMEVLADKQRIQQVFLNLIKNALDAVTEEGRVSVSARETAGSGGVRVVEIEVRDDGAGISPDRLDRIFDPFFTTKEVGRGSGLGLFIVHDIIERHGGTIDVESTVGKGTAFTIRLPQREEVGIS